MVRLQSAQLGAQSGDSTLRSLLLAFGSAQPFCELNSLLAQGRPLLLHGLRLGADRRGARAGGLGALKADHPTACIL